MVRPDHKHNETHLEPGRDISGRTIPPGPGANFEDGMERGWVRLWRKFKDWPFRHNPEYVSVWIELILRASYTHKRFIPKRGGAVNLDPGEFVASRQSIADSTGISPSKVQRILKGLEVEQQIEQQGTPHFRIIRIKNWELYQPSEDCRTANRTASEQQVNSNRTASEQQVNTIKKVKKDKKDKKEKNGKMGQEEKESGKPDGSPKESNQIREVFEYWRGKIAVAPDRTKLTDKRRGKIRARLREGFTVEDLRLAVDGITKSAWHIENGQAGAVVVFRDADQVEKFMTLANGNDNGSKSPEDEKAAYRARIEARQAEMRKFEAEMDAKYGEARRKYGFKYTEEEMERMTSI